MVSKKFKYLLGLSLCTIPVIFYSTTRVEAAPVKKNEPVGVKSFLKKNKDVSAVFNAISENTSSSRLSDFSSRDYDVEVVYLSTSDINKLFDSSLKEDVSLPFFSILNKYSSSDYTSFSDVYFPTKDSFSKDVSLDSKLRLESPYLLSDSFNDLSDLDLDGYLLDFSKALEKNNEKVSALMYLFLDKGADLDTQLFVSSYDDLNYDEVLKKEYIISLIALDDYLQTGFYQDLLEDKTLSDLVSQKKKDVDSFINDYQNISQDIYKAPVVKHQDEGSILKEDDRVFATVTLNVALNDHQYFNTGFSKIDDNGFDVTDSVKVLNNGRNIWGLSNVSSKKLDDGSFDYTYTFETGKDDYKRWVLENKDHKLYLEFIPSVSFIDLSMPGYDVLSSKDSNDLLFHSKQLMGGKSFYDDKLTLSVDVDDNVLFSNPASGQYLEHHSFNNAYALDNGLVKQFYPSISKDMPSDFSLYYVTNTDKDKVTELTSFDLDPGAIFSGFLFENALSGRLNDYTQENDVSFDIDSLMGPALYDDIFKYNASFLNFYFTSYYHMKSSNEPGIEPYEAFDDRSLDIPYQAFYYWLFDNYTLEVKSLMDQYYFDDFYESIQDKMMSLKLSMIRLATDHLDELKEAPFASEPDYMMFLFSLESNQDFIKKDEVLKLYDSMYQKALSDAKDGYNRSSEIREKEYDLKVVDKSDLVHKDGNVTFDFKVKADTDKYGFGEIKFENIDEFSDWDIDVQKTDDGYHYKFSISESLFNQWEHRNNFTVKLMRDYKVPYTQNTFVLYNQAKAFKSESIEVLTLPIRYNKTQNKVWLGFINEEPEEPVYPPVDPPETPPDEPVIEIPEEPVIPNDPDIKVPEKTPEVIVEQPEISTPVTETPVKKEEPVKELVKESPKEDTFKMLPQLGFKSEHIVWYLTGVIAIGCFGVYYVLRKKNVIK